MVCDTNAVADIAVFAVVVMDIFFLSFLFHFFFLLLLNRKNGFVVAIRYSVSFEGFHFACEWNSRFSFFSVVVKYT